MKHFRFPISDFRSSRRQRGVALVIVLAFVVLLTGLVVAYFSRAMWDRQLSDSSLHQALADDLARGALDIVTGDLKQEIANGSTTLPNPNPNNYPPVYVPTANANMVPVKNTPTAPSSTLLRISETTAIAAPGVDHPASDAPSTTSSANGRSISLKRWNKHYLLPLADPSKPTDTTPVSSGATAFTAPSWVYVTGTGPAVLTAPDKAVIGRYAYAVYDEGALLDVNVAGYPVGSGASIPPQYAPKGALAFADLTQLTLSGSTTPLLTQTGINNPVGWRNYASVTPTGNFPDLTFSGTAVHDSFKNLIISNTNGFLKVSGTAAPGGQTDQAFLSRQELIKFCLDTGTANFNPNALQYLGTFSRALNAPSWSPQADGGNGYNYKTDADKPASVNRNLPNVRFPSNATITHYHDDGTTETYDVQPGDPLLQRRFSLAKLAWFTPSGPASGKAAAIKSCFGLQWDSSAWRWDYVGATGSTTQTSIKTLAQVAQENREPNFFELLKAGILKGSLGQDPGPSNQATSSSNPVQGVQGDVFQYKKEPDMQVLQIGADIIDQADADSYPTAIHLNPFGLTKADDLSLQTAYGIENLPYLTGINGIGIGDPVPPSAGANGTLKFWMQPQLWNPNQPPASTPAAGTYPAKFRAYAYGSIMGAWYSGNQSLPFHYFPPVSYDDGSGSGDIASGSIYFTDTGDGTSLFYNNPRLLTIDSVVAPTSPQNLYNDAAYGNLDLDIPPYWYAGINKFAGFFGGSDPNYNPDPTPNLKSSNDRPQKYMLPNPVAYFSLQYQGLDGGYHPYNFMARVAQNTTNQQFKQLHFGAEVSYTIPGCTSPRGWGPIRVDPRTDRFSAGTAWWDKDSTYKTSMNPYAQAGKMLYWWSNWPSNNPHFVWSNPINPAAPGKFFFTSLLAINDESYPPVLGTFNVTGIAYYSDPDGGVRYADGYRGNTQGVQGRSMPATGDGCQLLSGDSVVSPASTLANPKSTNTPPGSAQARRPVILNRPFRSVGELGFAYRDLPFKTLDFWTSRSGDSALLDLFAIADQPAAVAGQINPGNAPAPVLKAILSGGAKSDALGVNISSADLQTLTATIAADLTASGPYQNRADLATRLGPLVSDPYTSGKAFDMTQAATANWANKSYAEMPVRALSEVTNTRTWNLLIDVVAQTGTFAPNAPQTTAALNSSFVVQGERRYWLHVAIDRFTGKVIDQQLEPVYE